MLPHASVQIYQIAVIVVEHLEIAAGRLIEENPSSAAEDFDVPFVLSREAVKDHLAEGFLPADPAHKAVHTVLSGTDFAQTEKRRKIEWLIGVVSFFRKEFRHFF